MKEQYRDLRKETLVSIIKIKGFTYAHFTHDSLSGLSMAHFDGGVDVDLKFPIDADLELFPQIERLLQVHKIAHNLTSMELKSQCSDESTYTLVYNIYQYHHNEV